jgi:hypothetical protein
MQNVGAGWLMTSLTMSPLMVGLVQAAGSIAVFLVVLPAGAIAANFCYLRKHGWWWPRQDSAFSPSRAK